jgi:hypothetical protein
MSEYQYYEFQAVDRPLTGEEMARLRACSTRARITPTSFVNDYSWGNFKGDEDAWMEKYFDAFLYVANWGTRVLRLRLPTRLLAAKTARLYCVGEHVSVLETSGKVILTFRSEDEGVGGWVEAEGELSSLVSARGELARGDLRAVYLGWLLCAQSGELNDDDLEPPVPAGLAELSPSLESLVEFLRIDTDLVRVAAGASLPLADVVPDPADLRRWLGRRSVAEKDDWLARLILENDSVLVNELLQRLSHARAAARPTAARRRRTVAELLRAAESASDERRRVAAEEASQEDARLQREAAAARAERLELLVGQEHEIWSRAESLIATRQPRRYDQAVALLADLRDLAALREDGEFGRRIAALRTEHARKSTLIDRLNETGLGRPTPAPPPGRGRSSRALGRGRATPSGSGG